MCCKSEGQCDWHIQNEREPDVGYSPIGRQGSDHAKFCSHENDFNSGLRAMGSHESENDMINFDSDFDFCMYFFLCTMDYRGTRVEAGKIAGRLLQLSRWEGMVAWTRVVVEMERTPQVPIFSLSPITTVCSRICSTRKLVHTSGLCWSLPFQEAFSDNVSPPRPSRSCVSLPHCPFSHLMLVYGLAVLWSTPGDAFISLVFLSPAVRLEHLWLDDLVTGTAHYEIEVVMCWVMAK